MCIYIYIYIPFIGWSDNHFNNLHFKISLETKETTTRALPT